MTYLEALAILTAQLHTPPVTFPPKGSPEQQAAFEQGQAHRQRFEQEQFEKGGFRPLRAFVAENRQVKRVLLSDPYFMRAIPGVEIEKRPDGAVQLSIVDAAGYTAPAPLKPSDWTHLNELQGTLFRSEPYVPWDPPSDDPNHQSRRPPPIRHAWGALFGTADDTGMTSGSWSGANGFEDEPKFLFLKEVLKLAVQTRRSCTFNPTNPINSFTTCFEK